MGVSKWLAAFVAAMTVAVLPSSAAAQTKPNILVIWGDDIGQYNISAYNMGVMGYRTPNIDRIANEGMIFADAYGENSCTAGRSTFITGQSGFRTGLLKVGLPGSDLGLKAEDPTIAEVLKPLGYTTGQFGKNHLGGSGRALAVEPWFRRVLSGNLYHLNAEEEPELPDYPKDPAFHEKYGPRGVIHSYADGRIEDTGPLTKKRMETVDEEFLAWALEFIDETHARDEPFFRLVQLDAHAHLDALETRIRRGDWTGHLRRRDGRARRSRRPASRQARRARHRRQHHRHVRHR